MKKMKLIPIVLVSAALVGGAIHAEEREKPLAMSVVRLAGSSRRQSSLPEARSRA